MTSPAEIKKFQLDLSAFADKAGVNAEVVIRKIALDLFTAIVKRTPVDTGRARSSWTLGIDNVLSTVAKKTKSKRSAGSATNKALGQTKKLSRYRIGQSIFIVNNLEYIVFLEDGTSDQAPFGMVKLAIADIQVAIGV